MNKWSNIMNIRNNHHALRHGHRSHPVTLLSAAVALADIALIDALVQREDIQLCAFHKWEAAGKPIGDGVQFWLEAEKELAEGTSEKLVGRDDRHVDRALERPTNEAKVQLRPEGKPEPQGRS
jgi:hypothetical protein